MASRVPPSRKQADAALTETEALSVIEQLQAAQCAQDAGDSAPGMVQQPSLASTWWQSTAANQAIQAGVQESSAVVATSSPAAGAGWQADPTSWASILQVLSASIKATSRHVEAVTLETLALGWLPLVRAHEREEDAVQGAVLDNRDVVVDLLKYAKWADAAYSALASPATLAAALGITQPDVLFINRDSGGGADGSSALAAHRPAYFLAVDHGSRAVRLVVRGTSALKDLVTDLCGHCVPFLHGHAHYGMMCASQALITAELARLESTFKAHPGYRLQVIGHSLGGGVAALTACVLRSVPELNARLGGADVTAITFATPPVMTKEMATECAPYIMTLVNNHDMISRTSVATLAELSQGLEAAKREAMQTSQVAALVGKAQVVPAAQAAVAAAFQRNIVAKPAAAVAGYFTKSPAVSSALGTGLSFASTALMARLAANAGGGAAPAQGTGGTPGQQPTAPSPAGSTLSGMFSSLSMRVRDEVGKMKADAKAEETRSAASTVPAGAPSNPPAGGTSALLSTAWSLFGAAGAGSAGSGQAGASQGDTTSKGVASTGGQSAQQPASGVGGWLSPTQVSGLRLLGGALLNKLDDSLRPGPQEAGVPLSPAAPRQASPAAVPQVLGSIDASKTAEEDQRLHRLYSPGLLLHLQRLPDAGGARLVQGAIEQRFQRLLLKRSMLSDHMLTAYVAELQALLLAAPTKGAM